MSRLTVFLREAGLVAAATFGAGIFALPYVFVKAGWLVGIFYLLILSAIIIFAHALYFRVLEAVDEKERLLGLAKDYLGVSGYYLSLVAIVAGLLLALVIHLILGGQFIVLLWPGVGGTVAIFIFWLLASAPLFFRERRVLNLEFFGVVFMAGVMLLIFSSAWPRVGLLTATALNFNNVFLPFGAVLFALAGWTAIEPLYGFHKRIGQSKPAPVSALAWGTVLAAALYTLFVSGILGSAATVTPDAVSGLTNWPAARLALLGVLGLLALWVSYLPISLEIKNSLQFDLGWRPSQGLLFVVFLPLILVMAGFSNFLKVVGLAGGVFLSLQYLIIVLVGKKVLRLTGVKKFLANSVLLVFALAAVYEIYHFLR